MSEKLGTIEVDVVVPTIVNCKKSWSVGLIGVPSIEPNPKEKLSMTAVHSSFPGLPVVTSISALPGPVLYMVPSVEIVRDPAFR
jgi:hypothetical protein